MEINNFIESMKNLNISLTDKQLQQFEDYYNLLIEWNEKINLTTIVEKDQVFLKHFYDSSTIVRVIDLNKYKNLCDIGTGAGFPGIVIKILFPNLNVTLVDSLQKRCIFLNEVITKLSLKNIEVVNERAEIYAKNHREKYDIVTSRAVAKLTVLLEYSIPMVNVNGYMIALKGNANEELESSKKMISILDSEIEQLYEFLLPIENSNRTILKIKKNKITNRKYPRSYSEIKKNK